MALFLSQLMNGIGQGVVYASLALALVLIYKTTGILNFAQGEMALVCTYLTWWFTDNGVPVWLAILLSVVAVVHRRCAHRTGRDATGRTIVAARDRHRHDRIVPRVELDRAGHLGRRSADACHARTPTRTGTSVAWSSGPTPLVLVGVLAVECVLLWLLLQKTKVGLALRAVASNPDSSRLVGVSVGSMLMLGWGLAAAFGAVAGSLVVPTTTALTSASMQSILVFAFAAAALGGFDSPLGAVVGGLDRRCRQLAHHASTSTRSTASSSSCRSG